MAAGRAIRVGTEPPDLRLGYLDCFLPGHRHSHRASIQGAAHGYRYECTGHEGARPAGWGPVDVYAFCVAGEIWSLTPEQLVRWRARALAAADVISLPEVSDSVAANLRLTPSAVKVFKGAVLLERVEREIGDDDRVGFVYAAKFASRWVGGLTADTAKKAIWELRRAGLLRFLDVYRPLNGLPMNRYDLGGEA